MKHVFCTVAILAGLVACTAADKQQLQESDAMEAKARNYCGVTMGFLPGDKTYNDCKEHYMQGLMDGAKTTQ